MVPPWSEMSFFSLSASPGAIGPESTIFWTCSSPIGIGAASLMSAAAAGEAASMGASSNWSMVDRIGRPPAGTGPWKMQSGRQFANDVDAAVLAMGEWHCPSGKSARRPVLGHQLLRRKPRRSGAGRLGCAHALEHGARQRRLDAVPLAEANDDALEFVDFRRTAAREVLGRRRPRLRINRQHAPGEHAENEV